MAMDTVIWLDQKVLSQPNLIHYPSFLFPPGLKNLLAGYLMTCNTLEAKRFTSHVADIILPSLKQIFL